MELYVKEKDKPKSCLECPCCKGGVNCGLDIDNKGYFICECFGGECPLKSLEEHDEKKKLQKSKEKIKEEVVRFYMDVMFGNRKHKKGKIKKSTFKRIIRDVNSIEVSE